MSLRPSLPLQSPWLLAPPLGLLLLQRTSPLLLFRPLLPIAAAPPSILLLQPPVPS